MCISHLFYICDQRFCQITVTVKTIVISARMTHPGTRMHFIDCHRLLINRFLCKQCSVLHPCRICPLKVQNIRYDRSCLRTKLCIIGIWICFIQTSSIFCNNQILIHASELYSRYKKFIHTHSIRLYTMHLVGSLIPSVKLSNDIYSVCMWRPYIKAHT